MVGVASAVDALRLDEASFRIGAVIQILGPQPGVEGAIGVDVESADVEAPNAVCGQLLSNRLHQRATYSAAMEGGEDVEGAQLCAELRIAGRRRGYGVAHDRTVDLGGKPDFVGRAAAMPRRQLAALRASSAAARAAA